MNTTLRTLLCATLLAAVTVGQDPALARARLLEQQEGDLHAAEQAYRALLGDAVAKDVQQQAALQLGTMLWRLDRKDEAKDLLERAAAGGGEIAAEAQAVLQGKGEVSQQEQERMARAQALVDRALHLLAANGDEAKQLLATTARDLEWLGGTAAQAIADLLRERHNQVEGDVGLARILWQIGAPPAQRFFAEVAADPDARWRQAMVTASSDPAADVMPALMNFLRVADPQAEVHRHVTQFAARLPVPQLQAMLADPLPQVRAAGLHGISDQWEGLKSSARDQLLLALEAPLQAALQDSDPRPQREAWRLLARFADVGPRAARRVFLEHLADLPREFWRDVRPQDLVLDDGEVQLLLAAARKRPPAVSDANRTSDVVSLLVAVHQPEWSARSIDAVLELVELDRGSYPGLEGHWIERLVGMASDAQLLRLIRDLPHITRVEAVIRALDQRQLPAGVFEAARDVFERCLVEPPQQWKVFNAGPSGRTPGFPLYYLFHWIARSHSPAAAEWLDKLVDRVPEAADMISESLIQLSIDGVGEPAPAAMRRLMLWTARPEKPLSPSLRSALFAELARIGDAASIPLFPRAYALGLSSAQHPLVQPPSQPAAPASRLRGHRGAGTAWSPSGIAFLGRVPDERGQPGDPWYGYDDEHLLAAWRTLLASDQRDAVIADVAGAGGTKVFLPVVILPLLAAELPAIQAAATDLNSRTYLYQALRQFDQVDAPSVAESEALHAAIRATLQHRDLGQMLLTRLPKDVIRMFEPEVRSLMRAADSLGGLLPILQQAGIELTAEDWLRALHDQNSSTRLQALGSLPTKVDPPVLAAVEAMLADALSQVRVAACAALARFLDPGSVAPLLQALRDSDKDVRAAAADALERLRFYQEQQAHWAQVQSGIEVSKDNALAKLLVQAKPDQPHDQRLLAIRSLAVLDQPEALPYLIDWTKDPDAAIAEAARSAVAAIHQAGATGRK